MATKTKPVVCVRVIAKDLRWMGSSFNDLKDGFPREIKKRAGRELRKIQLGEDADDVKPMPDVGSGTYEIRLRR